MKKGISLFAYSFNCVTFGESFHQLYGDCELLNS
jgi:hypothetical protein